MSLADVVVFWVCLLCVRQIVSALFVAAVVIGLTSAVIAYMQSACMYFASKRCLELVLSLGILFYRSVMKLPEGCVLRILGFLCIEKSLERGNDVTAALSREVRENVGSILRHNEEHIKKKKWKRNPKDKPPDLNKKKLLELTSTSVFDRLVVNVITRAVEEGAPLLVYRQGQGEVVLRLSLSVPMTGSQPQCLTSPRVTYILLRRVFVTGSEQGILEAMMAVISIQEYNTAFSNAFSQVESIRAVVESRRPHLPCRPGFDDQEFILAALSAARFQVTLRAARIALPLYALLATEPELITAITMSVLISDQIELVRDVDRTVVFIISAEELSRFASKLEEVVVRVLTSFRLPSTGYLPAISYLSFN